LLEEWSQTFCPPIGQLAGCKSAVRFTVFT
jgi:hypothetical protein